MHPPGEAGMDELVWRPETGISMVCGMRREIRAITAAALGLLTLLTVAGCVQRRMTIRSNPPGALVYVDDYQIGTTPVSTDFIYYGTRKIRLVKDGYETLTVRQPFPLPWYQVFPLDFVTENLWPAEIRDERVVDLAMMPAATTPPEEVVGRAEVARLSAGGGAAPPVVVQPSPVQPQPQPQFPLQQTPQPVPVLPPQPLPPPAIGPTFPPPPSPLQGLQPPLQNAPQQGIPSLGMP